jgi:hypothetical protein
MLLQAPIGHESVHQDAMLIVRTVAPQTQEELGAQPAQQINLGRNSRGQDASDCRHWTYERLKASLLFSKRCQSRFEFGSRGFGITSRDAEP